MRHEVGGNEALAPVLLSSHAGSWYLEQAIRTVVPKYLLEDALRTAYTVALLAEVQRGQAVIGCGRACCSAWTVVQCRARVAGASEAHGASVLVVLSRR